MTRRDYFAAAFPKIYLTLRCVFLNDTADKKKALSRDEKNKKKTTETIIKSVRRDLVVR